MKLNPWLPLPEDWQQASDDELGRWLVAAWMGAQADAAGFARGVPVPAAWAEDLIRATAALDSEVENDRLEAALRRACKGDREAAGRLLRDLLLAEGHALAMQDFAALGIPVARGRKAGGQRAGQAAKQRADPWQRACVDAAKTLLAQGKQPHELAGILARRFGKTPASVRAALRAAGIKKTKVN